MTPERRHRSFLNRAYAAVSSAAREGFRREGRGAVLIHDDGLLGVHLELQAVTLGYLADAGIALKKRGGWPTQQDAELIDSYDPRRRMVVCIVAPDDRLHLYHMALCDEGPPQGARIATKR